uniref:Uncharacterized protein n=1 Tax=Acrobeloides nanus TaxID=290746 RepID=A0A914DZ73_9BILA
MMTMHILEWLPAAIAVQIASAFMWLALIMIYVILLIDHTSDIAYALNIELVEANARKIQNLSIPTESPKREIQHNKRMITIIAELLFLLLIQIYISYTLYRVYKEQRRRKVSFSNQNSTISSFSPIQFSYGANVYAKKNDDIALRDY